MAHTVAAASVVPTTDAQPKRRTRVIVFSVLAGFVLTVIWSAPLVDKLIGENAASAILGHDSQSPITGVFAGIGYAFVTGLAGSFTACNVAAFGAVAPLVGAEPAAKPRFVDTLRPVGWIAIGTIAVSATYGVIVALVGTSMPQFSTATTHGLSARGIQSMIAFGIIGLAFLYLGLAALGVLRDPLASISKRFANARLVVMGALIGGFLIGRPYPLFRNMFRSAAEHHNVAYGAAAFTLQSLGNIVLMSLLFLLLSHGTRGRLQHWLASKPARIALVTSIPLLVAGTFTLLYWDVRVLGSSGLIWYPTIKW